MAVSTIAGSPKEVMKVYAARDYDADNPRTTRFVEVNIPEYVPTIPKDNKYEYVNIQSKYFLNTNYPATSGRIKVTHYVKVPLLSGTTCPTHFPKNTPFLLFVPTTKLEEGYLLYI